MSKGLLFFSPIVVCVSRENKNEDVKEAFGSKFFTHGTNCFFK